MPKIPRPEHYTHGAVVLWFLGLYRHQLIPRGTNTAIVSVDLLILLLLGLLLRFENRRVPLRKDRAQGGLPEKRLPGWAFRRELALLPAAVRNWYTILQDAKCPVGIMLVKLHPKAGSSR